MKHGAFRGGLTSLCVLFTAAHSLAQEAPPATLPEAASDEEVHEIMVVAARHRPHTASTSRVSARELAAVPRRNAEDALRQVPGLTLVQHGSEGKGHQFFLRGFDAVHGADLELDVDGIPVNEWSNVHAQGYIDLGFVIPEVIDHVEVTKGPFALGQGAFAMAGTASYALGIPESDRGLRTTYSVGTTNRHRGVITFSPKDGDGRDFIATEALHDDAFGQNRAINRGAVLGRTRLFDSMKHGTLSVLGSAYVARFELPGTLRNQDYSAGRVGFYDSYDTAPRGLSGRGLLALRHELVTHHHELSSLLWAGYRRLSLLENYTGFLFDPVNGDRRRQRQETQSFGARVDHVLHVTPTLDLETGLGFRGDALDQQQDHVGTAEELLDVERSLAGVQTLTHALLGLRWRPWESLRIAGGSRLDVAYVAVRDRQDSDRPGDGALVAVSPRLTVEWAAQDSWRLFLALGRGYRPPEARAFTSFRADRSGVTDDLHAGGDPTMTLANSGEVGTFWSPNRYLGVHCAGFATFIERETVLDHVSGLNLELNGTRRLGGELVLSSSPVDWLTLGADATLVDARFTGSGNPVPFAPWLTGALRAVATHESGLHAGFRATAMAPRPLPRDARGSAWLVLDATLGYRWRWLTLDLALENLLDQRFREGEYHYASNWRTGEEPTRLPVVHHVAGPPFNARFGVTAVF